MNNYSLPRFKRTAEVYARLLVKMLGSGATYTTQLVEDPALYMEDIIAAQNRINELETQLAALNEEK